MFFDQSTWLEGIWLRVIQGTFLQNYLKICQPVWEKKNYWSFCRFVAMETRILHGSQKFEGILVRSLRGCFLGSFIPTDPLVTEENKLSDDGRRTIGDHNNSPWALRAQVSEKAVVTVALRGAQFIWLALRLTGGYKDKWTSSNLETTW